MTAHCVKQDEKCLFRCSNSFFDGIIFGKKYLLSASPHFGTFLEVQLLNGTFTKNVRVFLICLRSVANSSGIKKWWGASSAVPRYSSVPYWWARHLRFYFTVWSLNHRNFSVIYTHYRALSPARLQIVTISPSSQASCECPWTLLLTIKH